MKKEHEFLDYLNEKVAIKKDFRQVTKKLNLDSNGRLERRKFVFSKKLLSFRFTYLMLLAIGLLGVVSLHNDGRNSENNKIISSFKSKKDLINYLKYYYSDVYTDYVSVGNTTQDIGSEAPTQGSDDYSETNIQDKEVDEGDIVKTDGTYIYFLSYDGFKIIKATKGNLSLTFKEQYQNYRPIDMFIHNNQAIILGTEYSNDSLHYSSEIYPGSLDTMCCYSGNGKTSIRVYDLKNINAPILTREISIGGSYITSRITNNTLYYFISAYLRYNPNTESLVLPIISDSVVNNGTPQDFEISKIYYLPNVTMYSHSQMLVLGKISLSNAAEGQYTAYLGSANDAYMSANFIYLYFHTVNYKDVNEDTYIIKITLDNLAYMAFCVVEGSILNRYSLDEYKGYLRVATTVNAWFSHTGKFYSNLYIFDEELHRTGFITNIAPGERIYAVRFNGDTGSIVTFQNTDPLFSLDLSNPYDPQITGELKEDGVSYYIHFIEDTPYSIGVGRDSRFVDGFVRWSGLKVTLYDNSAATAISVNTITIGDAMTYTELLYNPHALLYKQDRDIFAFPAEEWLYSSNYSSYANRQGLYVFGFKDGILTQRAFLTNFDSGYNYNGSYEYYNNYYNYIKRGLTIGDCIYTISERFVSAYSLSDFSLNERLEIAAIPN